MNTFRKTRIPAYIAIEGPIGVGKTSLAKRLAHDFEAELILEQPEANPFIDKFYQDPKTMALPTQLCFLFQRSKQLKSISQSDMFSTCRIADFVMNKDMLFAEATLDKDEMDLYKQVHSNMTFEAPKPDLVVYLQAPYDTLLTRIQRGGKGQQKRIEPEYLKKIADTYANFFHYYDDSPLLIVNASGLDIVNNDNDYEQLKARILEVQGGRHYFNPIPFSA